MAEFKNLLFKQHRSTKKGIQATMSLGNSKILSVVAGQGFYSNPGGVSECDWKDNPHPSQFSSFECAIINQSHDEVADEMDVLGWQSRDDINQIIRNNES